MPISSGSCAACSSAAGCAAHTVVALLTPIADLDPAGRYAVRHPDSRRYLTRGYPRPAWMATDVADAILYTPRELAAALPALGAVLVERVS